MDGPWPESSLRDAARGVPSCFTCPVRAPGATRGADADGLAVRAAWPSNLRGAVSCVSDGLT